MKNSQGMTDLYLNFRNYKLIRQGTQRLIGFLVMSLFTWGVNAQTVTVTASSNNVPIDEVTLIVDGTTILQTSPSGNGNPTPDTAEVIIDNILLQSGERIFIAPTTPVVTSANPNIGTNAIASNDVTVVMHDESVETSHIDPDFFDALGQVVGSTDLRSYWNTGSDPNLPEGSDFVNLMYEVPVPESGGFLIVTERFGNSGMDFVPLDVNGNEIPGATTVQVRDYEWNTGVNHFTNIPNQMQEIVVFNTALFNTDEDIFGFRVITGPSNPDGKLMFFLEADISIIKTGELNDENGNTCSDVDETITYTFTVANEGNSELSGVNITDDLLDDITFVSGDTDGDGLLDPTEIFIYTGDYEITQDDIDDGQVENQATVEGFTFDGTRVEDLSDNNTPLENEPTITPLCQDSSISVIKSQTIASSGLGLDDVITYDIVVTNTGNTTVTDIVVTDDNAVITGGNPIASLEPGDSATVTAEHTITQDDIDAGFVENTAEAVGDSPDGTDDVSDTSDTGTDTAGDDIDNPEDVETPDGEGNTNNDSTDDPTVTDIDQDGVIAIVKTSVFNDESGDGFAQAGETIDYTFTVTNEGNVSLSDIVITDPLFEAPNPVVTIVFVSGDTDGDGELDIDEVWIYTATYVVTQDDIDNGQVENQALATGTDPDGDEVSDDSDDDSPLEDDITITDLPQDGVIAIVKTGIFNDENGNGCADDGETITYTFTVTNEGNVSLSGVTVTDDLVDPIDFVSGDTDGDGELDPGETWVFTGTYSITQDDINAGEVINQATAEGTAPNGDVVSDLSDDDSILENDATITPLCQDAAIALVKTGVFNDENGDGIAQEGETITYTFTVTNTGNTDITNVVIDDELVPDIIFVSGDTDGDGVFCLLYTSDAADDTP